MVSQPQPPGHHYMNAPYRDRMGLDQWRYQAQYQQWIDQEYELRQVRVYIAKTVHPSLLPNEADGDGGPDDVREYLRRLCHRMRPLERRLINRAIDMWVRLPTRQDLSDEDWLAEWELALRQFESLGLDTDPGVWNDRFIDVLAETRPEMHAAYVAALPDLATRDEQTGPNFRVLLDHVRAAIS